MAAVSIPNGTASSTVSDEGQVAGACWGAAQRSAGAGGSRREHLRWESECEQQAATGTEGLLLHSAAIPMAAAVLFSYASGFRPTTLL